MHVTLKKLRLSLRPEKIFVGRSNKGFDLSGCCITPYQFSRNHKTKKKALENAKQRYAQRVFSSHQDLNCWRTWIHAGFPFKLIMSKRLLIQYVISLRKINSSP